MGGLQSELLRRRPRVEGGFTLFAYVTGEERLAGVSAGRRGRCYEKELSFPALVYWWPTPCPSTGAAAARACRACRARGGPNSGTTCQSAEAGYGQLGRVPVAVSLAFLSATTAAFHGGLPPAADVPPPTSLSAFEAVAVGGLRRAQSSRGRATVRAALYMATLVATRRDPVIEAHDRHLLARGKPKKEALVACMRKRLNYLTSLLSKARDSKARDGRPAPPTPAPTPVPPRRRGEMRRGPRGRAPGLWTGNMLDFQDSRSPLVTGERRESPSPRTTP